MLSLCVLDMVYQWAVTMRTLEDGSFEWMLQTRNLSDELGSRDSVRVVGTGWLPPPSPRLFE